MARSPASKLPKKDTRLVERRTAVTARLAEGGTPSQLERWGRELGEIKATQAKRIHSTACHVLVRANRADKARTQIPHLEAQYRALKKNPPASAAARERELRIAEERVNKARKAPTLYTRTVARLEKLVALAPPDADDGPPLPHTMGDLDLSPEQRMAAKVHLPTAHAGAQGVLEQCRRGGRVHDDDMGDSNMDIDSDSDDADERDDPDAGARTAEPHENGISNTTTLAPEAEPTEVALAASAGRRPQRGVGATEQPSHITIADADVQVTVRLPDQPYVWHGRHRITVDGAARNVHVELVVSVRDPTPELEEGVKVEPAPELEGVKVEPGDDPGQGEGVTGGKEETHG